jgi:hypothetical protein
MPDMPTRRSFIRNAAGGMLIAGVPAASAEAQSAARGAGFLLPEEFGAAGDGSRDDSAAIQRLIDAGLAQGRQIFVPAGAYRLDRPVLIRPNRPTAEAAWLAAGPKIQGAGAGLTVFRPRFGDGAAFDLDTDVDHRTAYRAAFGAHFEGFTVAGEGNAVGIRLRSAANVTLRGLHLIGLGRAGVEIVCQAGDNDGSNMVAIEQVRIEDVRGWGIDAAGAEGMNEISFLALHQVFIQKCGTASSGGSTNPASGGMRWKGQICTLEQCAFTLNRNVGLFVPGQAGLAQSLDLRGTTFENNHGRHFLCTGISGLKARNIQFYSRDQYRVSVACELDGSRHTIRSVDIDGAVVRADAGNSDQIAFRAFGPHAEVNKIRVRNVTWENFDHPGQKRFDGILFDAVRQCCALRLLSPTEAAFGADPAAPRGNCSPLRLRGGVGGAPAPFGEWVEIAIASDLVLANRGLAPGRAYWVYLYDDNGVPRLEASAAAPAIDRPTGYPVRPDDASRLAVGRVTTDSAGRFEAAS